MILLNFKLKAPKNQYDSQLCYFGVEIINANIYQKWVNSHKINKEKEEIEESIVVSDEVPILQRKGLVLGKKFPMKQY